MDDVARALLVTELNKRTSDTQAPSQPLQSSDKSEGNVHNLPFSERIKILDKFTESKHVKKGEKILCHSEAEVRKAIKKVSTEEGSEGAYLKKADFIYELDGKTLNNIKFKNELSCEVQIVKINVVGEKK